MDASKAIQHIARFSGSQSALDHVGSHCWLEMQVSGFINCPCTVRESGCDADLRGGCEGENEQQGYEQPERLPKSLPQGMLLNMVQGRAVTCMD